MLTTDDLSQRYRVTPRTVKSWRAQGILPPAVKVGGSVRWREQDIEEFDRQNLSATTTADKEQEQK